MILYFATGNPHKLSEAQRILERALPGVDVRDAGQAGGMPDVEETKDTFVGNARLKARALWEQVSGAKVDVFADDSGLCVDALDGAPGVRSARFAGPDATDADNRRALLEALRGRPVGPFPARFVCVVVWIDASGEETVVEGNCEGRITLGEEGSEGFGYDPVFIPDGYEQTMAAMGAVLKNQISHRAEALAGLARRLRLRAR